MRGSRIGMLAAMMALGLSGGGFSTTQRPAHPAPQGAKVQQARGPRRTPKPKKRPTYKMTGTPFRRVHPLPAVLKYVRPRSWQRLLRRLELAHGWRRRRLLRRLHVMLFGAS